MAADRSRLSDGALSDSNHTDNSGLVTFEDVRPHYTDGEDIFVVYRLASGYTPSTRDYLGLYRHGSSSVHDYIAFKWAPKCGRDGKFPNIRSILFRSTNINVDASEDVLYQFLYVTKLAEVIGASSSFRIHDFDSRCDLSFTMVDSPVEGVGSLTLIKSPSKSPDKDLLETFELVQSGSQSSNSSDGPKTSSPSLISLGILKDILDNMDGNNTGVTPPVHKYDKYDEQNLQPQKNAIDTEPPNTQQTSEDKQETLQEITPSSLNTDNCQRRTPGCPTQTTDHNSLVSDFQCSSLFKIASKALQVENTEQALVPYQTRALVPIYSSARIQIPTGKDELCWATTPSLQDGMIQATEDVETSALSIMQTAEARLLAEVATSVEEARPAMPIKPSLSSNRPHHRFLASTTPSTREKPYKKPKVCCKGCKRRCANLKDLRLLLGQTSNQLKRIQDELECSEEKLSLKTLLVDELSRQVKNLVHENGSLITNNEKIHNDHLRLQNLVHENRNLLLESAKASSQIKLLQSETKRLDVENAWLNHCIEASVEDNSQLQEKLTTMATERKQVEHAQIQCDVADVNNNVPTDWHPPLIVPEVNNSEEGWTVARSRKTERYQATIKEHENTITQLKTDLKHLQEIISAEETTVQELRAVEQRHLAVIALHEDTIDKLSTSEKQQQAAVSLNLQTIQELRDELNSYIKTVNAQKATIVDLDEAEERHLATIACLEDRIEEICRDKDKLTSKVEEKERQNLKLEIQFQEEKCLCRMLRHEVHDITRQLHASRDKEDSTSRHLITEKRTNMELRADIDHQVAALQQRILSLQDALETTQLARCKNRVMQKYIKKEAASTFSQAYKAAMAVPKRKPAASSQPYRQAPGVATIIQCGQLVNPFKCVKSSSPVSQNTVTSQPITERTVPCPASSLQGSLESQDSSVVAHGSILLDAESVAVQMDGAASVGRVGTACSETSEAAGSISSGEDASAEQGCLVDIFYEKEDARQEKKQKNVSRGKSIKAAKPKKPRKFVFQAINNRSGYGSTDSTEYTPRLHAANPKNTCTL